LCHHVYVCVTMFMFVSPYLCLCHHIYVCVIIFMFVSPCLCLRLHVYVCVTMFMFVSPCLRVKIIYSAHREYLCVLYSILEDGDYFSYTKFTVWFYNV
jgi:hypothetical protein